MPYYDPDKKLCYLATPRTASRATGKALRDVGFEKIGPHHGGTDRVDESVESVATTIRDPVRIITSWINRKEDVEYSSEELARHEIENNQWIEKGKVASRYLDEVDTVFEYSGDLQGQISDWCGESLELADWDKDPHYVTDSQVRIAEEFCQEERQRLMDEFSIEFQEGYPSLDNGGKL